MPRTNDRLTREARQKEAQLRAEGAKTLSARMQLARLDERLGEGVGAAKERARLEAQL